MVNLSSIQPVVAQGMKPERDGQTLVDSAGDTFSRLFNDVNNLQLNADRKIDEFATSKDKDIHGTMIALQKADLSLRLFLQVRSKLTSAYQEIMRMQV
ncbi:MAG TPA: flagellar hook-basal body complex protein FliE [bacterium]|nr:flagellar hook-basal body complex protein FliE [bacterium]